MNELFSLLKRPTLWQRGEAPFWDDEHISKGMLAAHLDPDADAASRRAATIEKSADWLASLAAPGCRILDLGCGPGLYCSRLSARGYDVTGVDCSRRSVAYAREHDPKTRYLCRDYLESDLGGGFDLAIMIYCDYAALTLPERQTLLANVRAALKPGGRFIFDVFTDLHYRDRTENTELTAWERGGFWSAEPYILLKTDYFYESRTVSVSRNLVVKERGTAEYLIWDTVYDLRRLTAELLNSGFQVLAAFDDVCGAPYTGEAETLCLVAGL